MAATAEPDKSWGDDPLMTGVSVAFEVGDAIHLGAPST